MELRVKPIIRQELKQVGFEYETSSYFTMPRTSRNLELWPILNLFNILSSGGQMRPSKSNLYFVAKEITAKDK